jgi:hypothetical protein
MTYHRCNTICATSAAVTADPSGTLEVSFAQSVVFHVVFCGSLFCLSVPFLSVIALFILLRITFSHYRFALASSNLSANSFGASEFTPDF